MANSCKKAIVVFTGAIGSGKSTACNYTKQHYRVDEHGNTVEFNFADPLKAIAIEMGFNPKHVFGNANDKLIEDPFWKTTPRKILETMGTEIFRNEVPKYHSEMTSVWVKIMRNNISNFFARNDGIVLIGDCRFDDELEMLQSLKGVNLIVVKIDDVNPNSSTNSTHISNTNFKKWDIPDVVQNNKDSKFFDDIDKILVARGLTYQQKLEFDEKKNDAKTLSGDFTDKVCQIFGFSCVHTWGCTADEFKKTLLHLLDTKLADVLPQMANFSSRIGSSSVETKNDLPIQKKNSSPDEPALCKFEPNSTKKYYQNGSTDFLYEGEYCIECKCYHTTKTFVWVEKNWIDLKDATPHGVYKGGHIVNSSRKFWRKERRYDIFPITAAVGGSLLTFYGGETKKSNMIAAGTALSMLSFIYFAKESLTSLHILLNVAQTLKNNQQFFIG
jgi:hypothetical protein